MYPRCPGVVAFDLSHIVLVTVDLNAFVYVLRLLLNPGTRSLMCSTVKYMGYRLLLGEYRC